MTNPTYKYISASWLDRRGNRHSAIVSGQPTMADAERVFRSLSWPGHKGGFWNYFKRDVKFVVKCILFGVR